MSPAKCQSRREFLRVMGAGAATLALPPFARAAAEATRPPSPPPNILFLFADQLHAFALGCMGNSEIRTPNLDRLAKEGTLFRNTYSSAPVCTPFRANLFTGRYGSQTGILSNTNPLPKGERTLAACLNDGGYRTGYIGKWHLGASGNKWIPPELRGDFTDFIGYQCYNDFLNNVCFFDEEGKQINFSKHRTDATTDIAIERLGRLADRRFALFVSYQNPHYPLQPSPQYEAMYKDVKITRRPNCRNVDPYTATASPPAPKPKETDPIYQKYGGNLDLYLQLYAAMVTQLDDNIGRLLASLDRLGLRDNTVVMFTSDHGDMQGSHGLKNKALPWEESTRIPGIVRAPGGIRGQLSDVLISSVDFLPSCLGYGNLPPKPTAEGADFTPVTYGKAHNLANRPVFSEMEKWCLIREDAFKLVAERPELKPTHLFNLEADPYEMKELVDDAAHAQTRERLFVKLAGWNARVIAEKPKSKKKRTK